jgi:hypothetical protein
MDKGRSAQQYITDGKGRKKGIIISLRDYKKMLDDIEELESIRAYDAAKSSGDERIPFGQAIAEIEKKRR